ncbi:MAG: indole-3-glycerol phosphate synthase TrpC [Candidatus Ratteibacteria bacterium]|nr:indole-3-glycerol phosphate synthase TrpC [Candidatus Ratteibacteria bacterium]
MVLDKIIKEKRRTIERQKREHPLEEFTDKGLRKTLSLRESLRQKKFGVIAEIKRASPSAGIIKKDIDVSALAKIYSSSGVSGISVLTCETFFMGSMEDIKSVRKVVDIPVLMKDFIIDPYQIYLGRLYGADVFLLILRVLSDEVFLELLTIGEDSGMEVIVEVHSEDEIKRALRLVKVWDNKILGINNRDLDTLKTDISTTLNLIKLVPKDKIVVISESGIKGIEDVERLKEAGIDGILVGESLLKSTDIKQKIQEFL